VSLPTRLHVVPLADGMRWRLTNKPPAWAPGAVVVLRAWFGRLPSFSLMSGHNRSRLSVGGHKSRFARRGGGTHLAAGL